MKTDTGYREPVSKDEQKILAARYAIDDLYAKGLLASGMKLGLGTGSTAMPAVARIGELIREGTLSGIRAVPTSFQTSIACEELGIPVYSMNSREIGGTLDLAIDGADEVTPELWLIKGGGAALLLEKIVAYSAQRFVIVADESKAVPDSGTRFPLPVEIIPEARTGIVAALARLGAVARLREGVRKAGPVVTDNGNLILDCLWERNESGRSPARPDILEDEINRIVGVVENGFFTRNKPTVYIAHADGSVEVR
ncbi:MAG: Ribose-5-phosphate isomerase A [Spirochaetes bacterium ADurb.Bin269]|nr:MAG: Ribose-5-phosphate isomerase A [Spirochaetes bacterium ADurb.Bin269]